MNIKGTIQIVKPVETFKSGSYKRSLVIKTDEQYPQILEVEFWNDKADQLELLAQGELISVDFNLNGRLWESREGKQVVFMSLSGYKISQATNQESQRTTKGPAMQSKKIGNIEGNFMEDAIRDLQEDDDDFPF